MLSRPEPLILSPFRQDLQQVYEVCRLQLWDSFHEIHRPSIHLLLLSEKTLQRTKEKFSSVIFGFVWLTLSCMMSRRWTADKESFSSKCIAFADTVAAEHCWTVLLYSMKILLGVPWKQPSYCHVWWLQKLLDLLRHNSSLTVWGKTSKSTNVCCCSCPWIIIKGLDWMSKQAALFSCCTLQRVHVCVSVCC